ncbi:hypothetical protein MD484_g1641, partial [Candolleomyces efflorescens]
MPSSPITTEHFPGPSTYPALSSKRRRHRYSSSSSTTTTTSVPLQPEVPRGCDSDDRRKSQGAVRTTSRSRSKKRADKDTDEEERAEKGMTIEYYDINGRLLRLWSNQGDLFTPPRDACLDEDGGSSVVVVVSSSVVLPFCGTVSSSAVCTSPDSSVVPLTAWSLEIEAPVTSTVVGREEEERRRRKRYLSEGSVPSAFREERVDVDWEGARWYSCVDVGVGVSVNGKGRDPVEEEVRIRVPDIDDQDDENKKEENDEEDTEEEEEEVLNPLPLSSSFFPPEWSTPPSFVENRRKSHSGVLSYTPNFSYPTPPTSTFTPPLTFTPPPTFTSTSTLNSTPGTSCLDTLPPLISAFGLGKGHPSFPPPLPLPLPLVLPRERKPTMGRWGRRAVVVSDPGVQGVTVVGVGGVGVGVGGFGTGVGMGVGGEGV